jgi:hypothetical protein
MSRISLGDKVVIEITDEPMIVSCLHDFPDGRKMVSVIGGTNPIDVERLTYVGIASDEEKLAARTAALNHYYDVCGGR